MTKVLHFNLPFSDMNTREAVLIVRFKRCGCDLVSALEEWMNTAEEIIRHKVSPHSFLRLEKEGPPQPLHTSSVCPVPAARPFILPSEVRPGPVILSDVL